MILILFIIDYKLFIYWYIYISLYLFTGIYISVYIYLLVYISVYIYLLVYISVYIYLLVYISVYIYLLVYIHIYKYISRFSHFHHPKVHNASLEFLLHHFSSISLTALYESVDFHYKTIRRLLSMGILFAWLLCIHFLSYLHRITRKHSIVTVYRMANG